MQNIAYSLDPPIAWHVVLIVPFDAEVVAIARNFDREDICLPGGTNEHIDKTPADTARRELLEETGLQAKAFELVDTWQNKDGSFTYAYKLTMWTGKLRSSSAGKTFLMPRQDLIKNKRLLKKLQLA